MPAPNEEEHETDRRTPTTAEEDGGYVSLRREHEGNNASSFPRSPAVDRELTAPSMTVTAPAPDAVTLPANQADETSIHQASHRLRRRAALLRAERASQTLPSDEVPDVYRRPTTTAHALFSATSEMRNPARLLLSAHPRGRGRRQREPTSAALTHRREWDLLNRTIDGGVPSRRRVPRTERPGMRRIDRHPLRQDPPHHDVLRASGTVPSEDIDLGSEYWEGETSPPTIPAPSRGDLYTFNSSRPFSGVSGRMWEASEQLYRLFHASLPGGASATGPSTYQHLQQLGEDGDDLQVNDQSSPMNTLLAAAMVHMNPLDTGSRAADDSDDENEENHPPFQESAHE